MGTNGTIDNNRFNLLASEAIIAADKSFFLELKASARGRFLKITEDAGGRRDTILLPVESFRDFAEAFARVVEIESIGVSP